MSDDILIKSKAIPSNPRSKNYPAGTTVVRSGGGTTTITGGGGSSIDILKVDDMRSLTDRNVFSSLRTLSELMSRIVKSDDSEKELTDENVLSSLRASNQLKAAVDELNASIKSLEDVYLFKTKDDTTAGHLTIEGGTTTDQLQSSQFTPGTLGSGYLIKYDPITGKSYIEVDEMYVRLKAVFDSLVIKESQHVGGQQIYSCASIECTKVDHIYREALFDSDHKRLCDSEGKYLFALLPSPVYRCYFTSTDGSKTILNQFVPGDLAQCRQFDIKDGTTGNAKNRYYWRYVVAVGDNYIDLSVTDCEEGSDVPEVGDKIIQLGNRTDASRQNAIIMSAYGENAPSKQMLQGIDSYSLVDKVILEEGFDRVTNQAYTKNYGKLYVGDRNNESYFEYDPQKGVSLNGTARIIDGTIKLRIDDNNVWEVDENCVNTIGNKVGEHIEINPLSKNIQIFNEEGGSVTMLEGKKYNNIEKLFPIEIPKIIFTESFPFSRSISNGINYEKIYFTDPFYTDSSIIISCHHKSVIQINNHTKSYVAYQIKIETYEDIECRKLKYSYVITLIQIDKFGIYETDEISPNIQIPNGYHKISLVVNSNIEKGGNAFLILSQLSIDLKIDSYMSKYFGNGLMLGTGNKNLFSIISKEENGNKYVSMLARNDNYGIGFDNNSTYSFNKGNKGMLPSIICYGSAGINTGGGFLNRARTFDGSSLAVSRVKEGVCRITFPASWKNLNIGVGGNAYIMLTGTGLSFPGSAVYPIKATFKAWLQGTGFDVYLSDDETPNDGEFYFEVKWF